MLAKVTAHRHGLRGVVLLWGLPTPRAVTEGAAPSHALVAQHRWMSVLNTAQILATLKLPTPPRLHVVTQGAQRVALDGMPLFEQAVLWGMTGALAEQLPRLRLQQIDVADPCSAAEAAALTRELLADTEDGRVVLRSEDRFVERIEATETASARNEQLVSEVLALPPSQAVTRLASQLRSHLSGLLPDSAAVPTEDVSLRELGLDSLTGLGLMNLLQQELGVRLPLHMLTPDVTILGLAELLLSRLFNRRHNA